VGVPALAALLASSGAWAYSTSFGGVLVLDDVRAIARNQTIRDLASALSPPPASTVSGRPVANLTFALNYALTPVEVRDVFAPASPGSRPAADDPFLRNVRGYHFLNLAIHLVAGILLFGVVRRTLSTDRLTPRFGASASWLAFVVALVWLVHPLHTESVTYVVQRVESLAGLFYLLTLYCAIRAAHASSRGARWWAAAAAVGCALGMATKEVMVTAPIAVWLWDRVFLADRTRRPRWLLLAALAATWIVLGALVYHEHRAPSIDLGQGMVWRYLLTQAAVVTHYLRLAFVPSPLVFLYTWPLVTSVSAVLPQLALLTGLVGLTILGLVRRHPLAFAGAWFLLILAPTSTVLPIVTEVAAEHRMYLPLASVVACVIVGAYAIGCTLLTRPISSGRRRVGIAIGAVLTFVLVVSLGARTRQRNRDYWSEEGLWQATVSEQPDNQRARVAYGVVLSSARRFAEAETELQSAVALSPADPIARGRLGIVQAAQGKFDEAIANLERALQSRPDDVDAHRALGQVYAIRQEEAPAVSHLERALQLGAADPMVLGRLAAILASSSDTSVGNGARAVALAERAATLTSRRDPMVLNVLSVAQAAVGRFADAASTADEALRLARAQGNERLASELEYRVAAYRARQKPAAPR
jgi:Flp pilus assembly protein TadD